MMPRRRECRDADPARQQRELCGRAGDTHNYDKGALHEQAEKDYATRRGYDPVVLEVSGDPGENRNRLTSPQTARPWRRSTRTKISGRYMDSRAAPTTPIGFSNP